MAYFVRTYLYGCFALCALCVGDATAGAWTLPQGAVWTKLSYFTQQTDEWYSAHRQWVAGEVVSPGARTRYAFEGQYDSHAAFLEFMYGVRDRLDLGVQVPYFAQRYADQTRDRPLSSTGIGDVRGSVKLRLVQRPLVLSALGAVKVPTGEYRNVDGLIPVGEGQWDFDLGLSAGRSLWPRAIYINADLGYRFRRANAAVDRDPGDEWFCSAEVGGRLSSRLRMMGKFEMLRGGPAREFGGLANRSQIKRIRYASAVVYFDMDQRTALEVGARISLGGRNYPAGTQWIAALTRDWRTTE